MSNFIDHEMTTILGWKRRADRSWPLGLPKRRRTVHVQRMANRRRDARDELHRVRQRRVQVERRLLTKKREHYLAFLRYPEDLRPHLLDN